MKVEVDGEVEFDGEVGVDGSLVAGAKASSAASFLTTMCICIFVYVWGNWSSSLQSKD